MEYDLFFRVCVCRAPRTFVVVKAVQVDGVRTVLVFDNRELTLEALVGICRVVQCTEVNVVTILDKESVGRSSLKVDFLTYELGLDCDIALGIVAESQSEFRVSANAVDAGISATVISVMSNEAIRAPSAL